MYDESESQRKLQKQKAGEYDFRLKFPDPLMNCEKAVVALIKKNQLYRTLHQYERQLDIDLYVHTMHFIIFILV